MKERAGEPLKPDPTPDELSRTLSLIVQTGDGERHKQVGWVEERNPAWLSLDASRVIGKLKKASMSISSTHRGFDPVHQCVNAGAAPLDKQLRLGIEPREVGLFYVADGYGRVASAEVPSVFR